MVLNFWHKYLMAPLPPIFRKFVIDSIVSRTVLNSDISVALTDDIS